MKRINWTKVVEVVLTSAICLPMLATCVYFTYLVIYYSFK